MLDLFLKVLFSPLRFAVFHKSGRNGIFFFKIGNIGIEGEAADIDDPPKMRRSSMSLNFDIRLPSVEFWQVLKR